MSVMGSFDDPKKINVKLNEVAQIKGTLRSASLGEQFFWFGTRTEYNSLPSIDPTICYCIEEGT